MPEYILVQEGELAIRWSVEAETPEEAKLLVQDGDADVIGEEWIGDPTLEIVEDRQ